MITKFLALAFVVAAICIAQYAYAAVPHPDRPITLSAERQLTLQPIPIIVKTMRCYSQVYLFGNDVLTVVRCDPYGLTSVKEVQPLIARSISAATASGSSITNI